MVSGVVLDEEEELGVPELLIPPLNFAMVAPGIYRSGIRNLNALFNPSRVSLQSFCFLQIPIRNQEAYAFSYSCDMHFYL